MNNHLLVGANEIFVVSPKYILMQEENPRELLPVRFCDQLHLASLYLSENIYFLVSTMIIYIIRLFNGCIYCNDIDNQYLCYYIYQRLNN